MTSYCDTCGDMLICALTSTEWGICGKKKEEKVLKGDSWYPTVEGIQLEFPKHKDNINHPPHYTNSPIETIDIIENTVADFDSYLLGNIIKYLSRYRFKNGLEDLEKAQWYLTRLIENIEDRGKANE